MPRAPHVTYWVDSFTLAPGHPATCIDSRPIKAWGDDSAKVEAISVLATRQSDYYLIRAVTREKRREVSRVIYDSRLPT